MRARHREREVFCSPRHSSGSGRAYSRLLRQRNRADLAGPLGGATETRRQSEEILRSRELFVRLLSRAAEEGGLSQTWRPRIVALTLHNVMIGLCDQWLRHPRSFALYRDGMGHGHRRRFTVAEAVDHQTVKEKRPHNVRGCLESYAYWEFTCIDVCMRNLRRIAPSRAVEAGPEAAGRGWSAARASTGQDGVRRQGSQDRGSQDRSSTICAG
jgi:hypothetical protein